MVEYTIPYPFISVRAPPEYRGLPDINPELCIGCGACANVCPPEAIIIEIKKNEGKKRVILDLARCIRCARCEEVCPTQAIRLSREFEGASPFRKDFLRIVELNLHRCPECGEFAEFTERQLKRGLEMLPKELYDKEELIESMSLCRRCRRRKNIIRLIKIAEEYLYEED